MIMDLGQRQKVDESGSAARVCGPITRLMAVLLGALALCSCRDGTPKRVAPQSYSVTGVVTEVKPVDGTVVVRHQAVPNYMPAMTMPFKALQTNDLKGILIGDELAFQLVVEGEKSSIRQIRRLGRRAEETIQSNTPPKVNSSQEAEAQQFTFTNEFGRAVDLADFKGQALALTFMFTRCPVPDYCPRLSKNFAEASSKLLEMPGAPTNWHFLSVTFDPEFDTPEVLRNYAARYQYASNHWSFLTGSKERISGLTRMFGFEWKPDSGLFDHGFRTVVINASNKVQQIYPFSGNLSDMLVQEILKASSPTNSN